MFSHLQSLCSIVTMWDACFCMHNESKAFGHKLKDEQKVNSILFQIFLGIWSRKVEGYQEFNFLPTVKQPKTILMAKSSNPRLCVSF